MSKLFQESDSDDETNFKTKNAFAENYDCWRQKEELNKREHKKLFKSIENFLN